MSTGGRMLLEALTLLVNERTSDNPDARLIECYEESVVRVTDQIMSGQLDIGDHDEHARPEPVCVDAEVCVG